MAPRIVVRRRLGHGREERGLGQREVLRPAAEVVAGRRLDAARAVPEIDVVQVHLEDLVLAELVLDLLGHAHLEELAPQRALLAGQVLGEDVAGELHGQRARALLDAARPHVAPHRPQHAADVDRAVVAEALVLDGDERLGHVARQRAQADELAFDGREVGERLAVAVEEDGRAARAGTRSVGARRDSP